MINRAGFVRLGLTAFLAAALPALASAATLQITMPAYGPSDPEVQGFLDEQFIRAVAAAEATYDGLTVGYQGFGRQIQARDASIQLDVVAVESQSEPLLVFNGSAADGRSESLAYRMAWHDAIHREIASILGLFNAVLASWEEGSRLYRRHVGSDDIEFLPIAEQRSSYPSLPLEPASFTITPPPDALVAPRYARSLHALRGALYTANVERLREELRGQSERRQARTLNQIGILHARFDEPSAARRAFEDATEADPDLTATYINLANLSLLQDDPSEALRWLGIADERRPAGVITTLLRAQAEYLSGNREAAAEQMTILEARAPDLAAHYPHLSGTAAGRASESQVSPVLPWAVDE